MAKQTHKIKSPTKPKTVASQRDVYAQHLTLLRDFTFNPLLTSRPYGQAKTNRKVSTRKAGKTTLVEHGQDLVTKNGVVLYPESVEFIFHLDAVPKKLLFFLLFYCVEPRKNTFLWNPAVREDFNRFSESAGGVRSSAPTLRDAKQRLVSANVILNLKRGNYMLNPLIAGGNSFQGRLTLIQEYTNRLLEKGKDPIDNFYPVFGKSKGSK